MYVRDSEGREVYIRPYGRHEDDITLDEAYYTDTEEDISDNEIDYILDAYAGDIYEEWYNCKIDQAESYYEGDR